MLKPLLLFSFNQIPLDTLIQSIKYQYNFILELERFSRIIKFNSKNGSSTLQFDEVGLTFKISSIGGNEALITERTTDTIKTFWSYSKIQRRVLAILDALFIFTLHNGCWGELERDRSHCFHPARQPGSFLYENQPLFRSLLHRISPNDFPFKLFDRALRPPPSSDPRDPHLSSRAMASLIV